jgi:hypothetical protein
MKNLYIFLAVIGMLFLPSFRSAQAKNSVEIFWFHEATCSVCQQMSTWLDNLQKKYPEVQLRKFEVSASSDDVNSQILNKVASAYGKAVQYVPVTFINNQSFEGFDDNTAVQIDAIVSACIDGEGCTSPSQKLAQMDAGVNKKPNSINFKLIGGGILVVLILLFWLGRKI